MTSKCLFRGFEFVKWSAGIEYVSGALSKGGDKNHHNHSKMLIATHRTAATTTNCNNIYLRDKVVRTSPLSQDEQAALMPKTPSNPPKGGGNKKIAHSGDFFVSFVKISLIC